MYPRAEKMFVVPGSVFALERPCTEENTHRVEEIYRSSDGIWLPSLKRPFQYLRVTFQQKEDSPAIFCLMPNTPHHSQHLSN